MLVLVDPNTNVKQIEMTQRQNNAISKTGTVFFIVLCFFVVVTEPSSAKDHHDDESIELWDHPDERSELKGEILEQIDDFNRVLMRHDKGTHGEHFMALTSMIGISMVDGVLSTLFSRMVSTIQAKDQDFIPAARMGGFYTAMAMVLAYEMVYLSGYTQHTHLFKHLQFTLESMGFGQVFGFLTWYTSSKGWGAIRQADDQRWWVRILSHNSSNTGGYSQELIYEQDSASHYAVSQFIWAALYYYIRAGDYGLRTKRKLALISDDLVRAREALARIEDEERGINRGISLGTTDLHSQDRKRSEQTPSLPDDEEDLHQEEFDLSELDLE